MVSNQKKFSKSDHSTHSKKPSHSKKQTQYNKEKTIHVTLPYDFIPFANEFHYAYPVTEVPKHDAPTSDSISGYIDYEIQPCSDLVLEVRKKYKEEQNEQQYFVSGSSIRGKIRANLEILSASYPEFINRDHMMFRDIAGGRNKVEYATKMGLKKGNEESVQAMDIACGINHTNNQTKEDGERKRLEETIQVGFLENIEGKYYVTPAQTLGDKNFLSIKEHVLMKWGVLNSSTSLYSWRRNDLDQLNKYESKIKRITSQIKELRSADLEEWERLKEEVSTFFLEEYSFTTRLNSSSKKNERNKSQNKEINLYKIVKGLKNELSKILPSHRNWYKLSKCYALRWGIKAKIHLMYRSKGKNNMFMPYQRTVFITMNANNGISDMFLDPPKGASKKGYLFNSTNASSKRSHYFVMEPNKNIEMESDKNADPLPVSQTLINAYNKNLTKIRFNNVSIKNRGYFKDFYDIFKRDASTTEKKGNNSTKKTGLIVFYNTNIAGEIIHIGRTPYFKVPYKNQIDDLIPRHQPTHFSDIALSNNGRVEPMIDYAKALFGFTQHDIEDFRKRKGQLELEEEDSSEGANGLENLDSTGYKSRLRFSPVDIIGDFDPNHRISDFLLAAPSATASAMYLHQEGNELKTYEQDGVKLNGYKYYHVRDKPLVPEKNENLVEKKPANMLSTRFAIRHNTNLKLTGRIYFQHLKKEELGLLLLSIDLNQLTKSNKYKKEVQQYESQLENTYEMIGGAKPYGYGKVKFCIKSLHVNNSTEQLEGADLLQSLVMEPYHKTENYVEHIDAWLDHMGYDYFITKNIHLNEYIQSKTEINSKKLKGNVLEINWENIGVKTKGGGYYKGWRLKKGAYFDRINKRK